MPAKFQPLRKLDADKRHESPFAQSLKNRKKRGIDWSKVDAEMIRYAACACVTVNATLVIAPAMGGLGATIRVWKGDDKWVEYANDTEGFDGWMEAIGDYYASSSEDLRVVLGLPGGGAPEDGEEAL